MKKNQILKKEVKHFDIKKIDALNIINQFENMAFQSRNLARASKIYDLMLKDKNCSIILCLAGSLISAGLKKVITDLIDNNMIDAIVSTGANIIDQDFFEALGYKHYIGTPFVDDNKLMKMHIDRIYDTYINEDELKKCDITVAKIAQKLQPKAYSSREFIFEMGRYLKNKKIGKDSIIYKCFKNNIPIFVPAFSDCSAGLGLAYYQNKNKNKHLVTIDSVKDFLELTKIKIKAKSTGLLMIAGGVPKNFAQDTTVSAELLSGKINMHKYVVQITVADERDGALSGSTLKEAHSWGKVSKDYEQMVFSEATIAFPLLAAYAYQKKSWKNRSKYNWNLYLKKIN